jgi:hypothetical protein
MVNDHGQLVPRGRGRSRRSRDARRGVLDWSLSAGCGIVEPMTDPAKKLATYQDAERVAFRARRPA